EKQILSSMQGTYNGCVPWPFYAGIYQRSIITISGDSYTETSTLNGIGDTTCTSPILQQIKNYKIIGASYEVGDSALINLDFEVGSIVVQVKTAAQRNKNFC